MVLLIIIPMKNCYFIGNIPYFQTNLFASMERYAIRPETWTVGGRSWCRRSGTQGVVLTKRVVVVDRHHATGWDRSRLDDWLCFELWRDFLFIIFHLQYVKYSQWSFYFLKDKRSNPTGTGELTGCWLKQTECCPKPHCRVRKWGHASSFPLHVTWLGRNWEMVRLKGTQIPTFLHRES